MVKLLADDTQTLRRPAAGTGMYGRASGWDMMLNGVFDGCILGTCGGQGWGNPEEWP